MKEDNIICEHCLRLFHSIVGLKNHIKYCSKNPDRIESPNKNRKCTEEHKRKVSEALKGKKFSDEHRKKISENAKCRKHTEEWKKEHSARMSGEGNSFYGKHHTNETKEKISNKNKGKSLTEERKLRIKEWSQTYWSNMSEEELAKFSQQMKTNAISYWNRQSPEDRLKFAEKISKSKAMLSDEEKKEMYYKGIETKRKNGTVTTSTIESLLIEYFNSNNIEYIHQYKSDKYPFMCDFYFPVKDLYVEIQGCWTHGGRPYVSTDTTCIKQLELWKSKNTEFYNNAIDTWTERDVKKRNHAKEHNLNWIEIFSNDLDECLNVLNYYNI